jgi:hypothetical protein
MRNECLFALEWVAYHRAIGFDDMFVCTNDCDDGTDEMMDRLQALGLVHHIGNEDRRRSRAATVRGQARAGASAHPVRALASPYRRR